MYSTIIVPIDLTHAEKGKAMIEAAKEFGGGKASVVLLNVVEEFPTYVAAELPTGTLEKLREDAQTDLDEIAKSCRPDTVVEIRRGRAHDEILAAAEEKNADLIIIASHRPGIEDYLLGSTAARVVRHANCSVLVMR